MFKSRKRHWRKKAGLFFWVVPLVGLSLLVWVGLKSLDWQDPWVRLPDQVAVLGANTKFVVKAGDPKSGLREVQVAITQDGQKKVALTQVFPPGGEPGSEVELPVTLESRALGLKEGKATITVSARDRSWRNLFRGRTTALTRDVVIDLVPLNLTFLAVNHLLHYGGTGLIIYHMNKEVKESGVVTEGLFFRGFPNPKGQKGDYLALFPLPLEPSGSYQVELVARPLLGKEVRRPIPLKLRPRRWRHDKMNLSEGFLRQVAASFSAQGELVQAFLSVNRDMRRLWHQSPRAFVDRCFSALFGQAYGPLRR
jgi:hypothetical protein